MQAPITQRSFSDPERVFVPDRFRDAIEMHLVRTLAGRGPRLLLLFGPPGEGKSRGLRQVLHDAGVLGYFVPTGEMESPHASAPARKLLGVLRSAGHINQKGGLPRKNGPPALVAIVLEDIDLGLGGSGPLVQRTINTDHLIGTLMAFCDQPGGRCRVPVFLTANRPDVLYGPLIRSGRAELLRWVLRSSERRQIVRYIFPGLAAPEVAELIEAFGDQSVAFFADLERTAREHREAEAITRFTAAEAVR